MRNDHGYSVLEAFLLGLVLLLPLIWLLTVSADVQRSALASASAVREAGLAASRAASASDAHDHADSAARRALLERGVTPAAARISLSSDGAPGRGELIEVRVETPVHVLRVPFLREAVGPAIWIRARNVARVEPYRSRG